MDQYHSWSEQDRFRNQQKYREENNLCPECGSDQYDEYLNHCPRCQLRKNTERQNLAK